MKSKQITGLTISTAILIISCLLPAYRILSAIQIRTLGFAVSFLVMLITEALPISVTCLTFLALMPIVKIAPTFSSALSGFSNQVVFFIIASFGIAAGFTNIPLSKRVLIIILKKYGKNVKSILFSIMLCTALLSSVVSNVPTCAIFMTIGTSFLELYKNDENRKNAAKAFMIGIPVASMIGGMMTPAGSSINLLAIELLEQATGQTITFVKWMAVGIPFSLIVLPIAWILMVKIYKPKEIAPQTVHEFINNINIPKTLSSKEKKVIFITGVMLILWIMSSWVRSINVMVVALLGCCVLFMPKIEVLEWKDFSKSINWDSFFLVGTVLSLGNIMVNNGISDLILTFLPTWEMNCVIFVAFCAILLFVMLVVIPVAPSLVTIMASPLIALSTLNGISPAVATFALAFCAANCYLLPLDTVTLLTYSTGTYSMRDMPKSTLPLQIWVTLTLSLWLPFICKMLKF